MIRFSVPSTSVANSYYQPTFCGLRHQEVPQRKKAFCKRFSCIFIVVSCPFQQSFEVVADRCREQTLVGESNPSGVHPSHAQKVHKGTDHRFNCCLPELFHFPSFACLHPQVHLVIEVFVHGVFDLFKVTFYRCRFFARDNAGRPMSCCGILSFDRYHHGNP